MNQIKFNLYNVTCGDKKARVHYSINNRIDGKDCVTLYAQDYDGFDFIDCSTNDSDYQSDYIVRDRAVVLQENPLYKDALKAAIRFQAKRDAKYGKAMS